MSPEADDGAKPPKKYPRSTSPRSVERRRLQNRIAQRNHRRKIKEATRIPSPDCREYLRDDRESDRESSSDRREDSVPGEDLYERMDSGAGLNNATVTSTPPSLSVSGPASISGSSMDESFMPGAPATKHWLGVDQMMKMNLAGGTDPLMGHAGAPNYFTHPGCACNSVTGPCVSHLEKLRTEMMAMTGSPHPMQQFQHLQQHFVSQPVQYSQYGSPASSETQQQQSNHPGHLSRNSTSSFKRCEPSPPSFPSVNGSPSTAASMDVDSSVQGAGQRSTVSTSSTASSVKRKDSSPAPPPLESEVDITERFKPILDAVRGAGFPDFDKMVVAYYTARFQRGSPPALAQRASRGRRLKTMLQDLRESSEQWPQWESRGLQESAIDATRSLCLEEIERLETDQTLDLVQIEAADLTSAFGWLFSGNRGENEDGSDEDGGNGNGLSGDRAAQQYVSTLSERIDAVQDSIPYLWSLLTELAGPQKLYCDKTAQVILAILLDTRRMQ